MKRPLTYITIALTTVATALLQSCIKDEALNHECDILQATVPADRVEELFFQPTDATVDVLTNSNTVTFKVKRHADVTALAPTFVLSEGATISPESGSTHDFSAAPVAYTVTSESQQWRRNYLVEFVPQTIVTRDELNFDFENYTLEGNEHKYYEWKHDADDDELGDSWATGNPGFRLSMSSAAPEEYPTTPLAEGKDGAGVRLTTRSTGAFGEMVNMRLAAGNLFLGTFDVQSALLDAMRATQFGVKFNKRPVRFTGYYRYKPGAKFQDRAGNTIEGRTDKGDIYSVLYRNHDNHGNAITLYGDNVLTSENIVAVAQVKNIQATDEWTPFDIAYEMRGDIDLDLLEQFGYNLTIVFSSSINGAAFEGAIGSTLEVDNVKVICETIE